MAWFDDFSGTPADSGGSGIGSGGFNFLDAQAGNPVPTGPGGASASGSVGATGSSSSSGLFGTSLTGKELTSIGGAAVAGGALAYNLHTGDKVDPNITSLNNLVGSLGPEAAQQFAQGNQYASYLGNGTLPAGLESEVQANKKAGQARYLQNAASSGLSADPTHNSALSADLNSLDSAATAQRAQYGQQLLAAGNTMISNGIQISNMDAGVFKYLADYDLKKSQATGSAISAFAAALGGIGGAFFGGPAGAAAGATAGKAVGSAFSG